MCRSKGACCCSDPGGEGEYRSDGFVLHPDSCSLSDLFLSTLSDQITVTAKSGTQHIN